MIGSAKRLLAVAAIAGLLGGLAGCPLLGQNNDYARQARNLTRQSIARINALYGADSDGVSTATLVATGVFPATYIRAGHIVSPWGGAVTARPASNYGWRLVWTRVPSAICMRLAEWYGPTVQDVAVDGQAFAAMQLPLSPGTAQTLCAGPQHRVSFHVYAG